MNQPLEFPFGFYTNDNTPQDGKYFNRITGRPYADMATALSLLPYASPTSTVRYEGLIINIAGVEYWWPASDPDLSKDPIIKINPSNTIADGKIEGGEIDISDFANGNITVGATKWLLTVSGTQALYQTTTDTIFSGIGLSSSGNQRYVAFFGNASNVIIKVEGAQSAAAVMPTTPISTVLLGYVLITDVAITPPVIDLSGYAQKNAPNVFTDTNTFQDDVEFKKLPTLNGGDLIAKSSSSALNTGTDNATYATPLGLQGSKYLDRAFAKISATTTGTSSAYVASLSPALASYVAGQPIVLNLHVANSINATVTVNGLGARNLARIDGSNVQANDLPIGRYMFIDDGSKYRLITPVSGQYIDNQNSALQAAAALWIATGRFDTGIGLGVVNNIATWLNILANTTSKSQVRLNPSTVDVSAPVAGDVQNNSGVVKIHDGTGLTPILKGDRNPSLAGSGNAILIVLSDGSIARGAAIDEGFTLDADIISAIGGASWSGNRTTIAPTGGKTFYQGDMYDDGSYTYIAYEDNKVRRW